MRARRQQGFRRIVVLRIGSRLFTLSRTQYCYPLSFRRSPSTRVERRSGEMPACTIRRKTSWQGELSGFELDMVDLLRDIAGLAARHWARTPDAVLTKRLAFVTKPPVNIGCRKRGKPFRTFSGRSDMYKTAFILVLFLSFLGSADAFAQVCPAGSLPCAGAHGSGCYNPASQRCTQGLVCPAVGWAPCIGPYGVACYQPVQSSCTQGVICPAVGFFPCVGPHTHGCYQPAAGQTCNP
jgi:hypothetical protein